MTLDERRNEVLKLHAGFLNALAIGAVVGGGFGALNDQNWSGALIFGVSGFALHLAAAELIERMRIAS